MAWETPCRSRERDGLRPSSTGSKASLMAVIQLSAFEPLRTKAGEEPARESREAVPVLHHVISVVPSLHQTDGCAVERSDDLDLLEIGHVPVRVRLALQRAPGRSCPAGNARSHAAIADPGSGQSNPESEDGRPGKARGSRPSGVFDIQAVLAHAICLARRSTPRWKPRVHETSAAAPDTWRLTRIPDHRGRQASHQGEFSSGRRPCVSQSASTHCNAGVSSIVSQDGSCPASQALFRRVRPRSGSFVTPSPAMSIRPAS